MSDVFSDNRSLAQDPLIVLFKMDFTTSLYYQYYPGLTGYNFTGNTGGTVTFGGTVYHPTGVNYQNDTITIDGRVPRASLEIDLQDPAYRSIINLSQATIKGVRLTVIYTREKYLSVSSPVKNVHYEQEVWYCDNFTSIKKGVATIALTIGIGLETPTSVGEVLNTYGS